MMTPLINLKEAKLRLVQTLAWLHHWKKDIPHDAIIELQDIILNPPKTEIEPHETHKKDRLNKSLGDCDEMYCKECNEVTGHLRQPNIAQPNELALTCCICNTQKI